jgi:hypothetical protein
MRSAERHRQLQLLITALNAALAVVIGCGSPATGPQRFTVDGSVTFGGQPVPMGRIVFEPDSAAGNNGPVGMADIKDGRYASGLRFGAVGGPHEVVIEGFESPGPDGLGPDESPRPLFREYRTKIDLPKAASIHDFDVPEQSDARRSKR